ncbi:uncharacterized protein MONOS_13118 [Monocercomonoides exilis]|uniref:uncharacterized protein n=1 Tax=Monocercomonoides exilis TaxID=2049356 RepID=UPI0035599028|nr:hypothetical protein MONOS_13118 [Monocercomonoides exilis]|eukprot:MONOS_13118.1-p1 / transcript=MONOS_13118.1 / gene=MONOS_13118 / organism=Monocercomonoides_exilis_PA203 / gene_product=unspecified product / transcript_product=unspecified product / location=Mono_scaffold00780:3844-4821(+) / protein_length=306 / sequence_SO=supercontig / SO=protein_coding / is_pseudo=false
MENKQQLSPLQLRRTLALSEYRNIKSASQKVFEIKRKNAVNFKTAIESGAISKSAWYRGIKAEKSGRVVKKEGHPLSISKSQLETIENQVMAMLSEDTIVRVKDIQSMCVDLSEKECDEKQIPKTVNCKYAHKLIKRSEVLQSALSRPLEMSKISAQSPENIQKWFLDLAEVIKKHNIDSSTIFNFDETSLSCGDTSMKLVVCMKNQIPPSPPKPPKVPNATLCLCICADGSSLPRFLLWPRKETPDEFSSLSAFDIRYIYSSSGWITKEIYREIMIGCWIPLISSKVKPTSTKKSSSTDGQSQIT